MPPVKPRKIPAAAGADRGASWTRFCAVDSRGEVIARDRLPTRDIKFFPAMIKDFLDRCGSPPGVPLFVATRGAFSKAWKKDFITASLAGRAETVGVISDAEAAYGSALGARRGFLIIAGTGSVALAPDGRGGFIKAGGHAPEGGDPGSGLWLGLAWLRLKRKRVPSGEGAPGRAAAFAAGAVEKARGGDAEALELTELAWNGLAALAGELKDDGFLPGGRGPLPAALWGGLTDDEWFRAGLVRALEKRLSRKIKVFRPSLPPELYCALKALKAGKCAKRKAPGGDLRRVT